MPSIEDMAEGPQIEVEMLPIESIEFDPQNPNEMSDEMYEALVGEIRDYGFAQPVAVWRRPDGTVRMIDGEHRAKALRDLGARNVPAIVVDAADEDDAQMRLVVMNHVRGEPVPLEVAYLLKDLATRIPEKEMRKRLGMEQSEWRDRLHLADFTDPVGEKLKAAYEKELRDAPTVLKFVVSSRDAAAVERVVDSLVDGKTDRGKALAAICRSYEKASR